MIPSIALFLRLLDQYSYKIVTLNNDKEITPIKNKVQR